VNFIKRIRIWICGYTGHEWKHYTNPLQNRWWGICTRCRAIRLETSDELPKIIAKAEKEKYDLQTREDR